LFFTARVFRSSPNPSCTPGPTGPLGGTQRIFPRGNGPNGGHRPFPGIAHKTQKLVGKDRDVKSWETKPTPPKGLGETFCQRKWKQRS
ncbi:hypothetical protein CRENBAI_015548, partial [Crenichthys baileyi]